MAEQRFNAVMEGLRDGLTVIEVAERYGVSRQTIHGWLGRYRTGGLEALADRSHRPRRCPHQMPATVEAQLCELRRRHPHWGQRRLAHELVRIGVDPPPGLTSIYRALVRNGLIHPMAGLVERANAPSVCRIFTQALARYGTPEEVLTDIQSRWCPWCLVRSAGRGHALRDRRPSAAVA